MSCSRWLLCAEAYRGGQLAGAGEELRARILYQDEELLVLNKPPGLAVQGGPGISVSLDRLAERELGQGSLELPRQDSAHCEEDLPPQGQCAHAAHRTDLALGVPPSRCL